MELDDLKRQLYKKGTEINDRPHPPEEFDLGRASLTSSRAEELKWQEESKKQIFLSVKQKRWAALGLVVLVLALGAALGGIYWWWAHSFDKTEVALDIFGTERVVSGEEVNYVVRIKNNTRVNLQNAKLEFLFPTNSVISDDRPVQKQGDLNLTVKNISGLAPGQESQETFKIRVLGDKDTQQKFLVKFSYRPANASMDFINEKDFSSTIISVPLVLGFVLPEKMVSGQTLNFSLKYVNTSDATFSASRLKIEYPDGFVFDGAVPSPSEGNNLWDLSEIGSGEEGKIILKGVINGNEGDSKVFKAQIGMAQNDEFVAFAQTLSSPQISISPLTVEQEITNVSDGQVNLGQLLSYKLKYKNTTDVTIGPVVVSLKIDSKAVDFGSVIVPKGFFNSLDNIITWNAASLSGLESLAAGNGGELVFSFKVKDKLAIGGLADKNFTINTLAQIDSPNTPLALTGTSLAGKNQLAAKVNSRLVLSMRGYYNDRLLPNSGPLPPRVGQETTYTIYWELLNISNDLTGITVEAYLPSYIHWKGNIYPKTEDIKYDESAGKLVWKISRLAAGTGILWPVRQVVFQVGFLPSLGQVGDTAVVVKEVQASGKDSFTEKNITVSAVEMKSDMPSDSSVGFEKGRVQN